MDVNGRARRLAYVWILVMVMALACTCLPSGKGAGTPSPLNVPFQDDFSDEGSGWEVGEYEEGSVGYKSGTYSVISERAPMVMWGVANRSFNDVVIDVDAVQVSAGPDSNNAYGIVCREQGNGDGYYLRVSGDGYYSIGKAEGEEFETLVEWAESDAIRQGNASNHIQAMCDGSTLTLFVNGRRLAAVEDNTFASGDIALTMTTFEGSPSEARFDNLVAKHIEEKLQNDFWN